MPQTTSEPILNVLTEGNARFASGRANGLNVSAIHRESLIEAQHPLAVVVACSDARVSPEIIFDVGLGDLFVVRTAGNLVDQVALESIAYAVEHLNVSLLIIMGHSCCGAVTMAANMGSITPKSGKIANMLKPALDDAYRYSNDPVNGAVQVNVIQTVARFQQTEPISDRVADQSLFVCGAIYQLENGLVQFI